MLARGQVDIVRQDEGEDGGKGLDVTLARLSEGSFFGLSALSPRAAARCPPSLAPWPARRRGGPADQRAAQRVRHRPLGEGQVLLHRAQVAAGRAGAGGPEASPVRVRTPVSVAPAAPRADDARATQRRAPGRHLPLHPRGDPNVPGTGLRRACIGAAALTRARAAFAHQTFTDAQRETVIAAMKTATFRRGTYIVRQGEVGDRFYIILEVRSNQSMADCGPAGTTDACARAGQRHRQHQRLAGGRRHDDGPRAGAKGVLWRACPDASGDADRQRLRRHRRHLRVPVPRRLRRTAAAALAAAAEPAAGACIFVVLW